MSQPSASSISIAGEPRLGPDGYVELSLIVDGQRVRTIVDRSRGVGAPDALSAEIEGAAIRYTMAFTESHALLFHRLFDPASSCGTVTSVSLDESRRVAWFKMIANGVECEMGVSPSLVPQSFRLASGKLGGTDEDLALWGTAYDACLAYMSVNVGEIERLGFDVSELIRQLAEVAR
jgi:hypothetical protein